VTGNRDFTWEGDVVSIELPRMEMSNDLDGGRWVVAYIYKASEAAPAERASRLARTTGRIKSIVGR
jgi:hypothetical protein